MKTFLVDEGISRSTIQLIHSYGHSVKSVRDVNLHGAPDEEIAIHAAQHDEILLTLDQDFGELYHFLYRGKLTTIPMRAYPDVTFQINTLLEDFLKREDGNKILSTPCLVIISNNRTWIIP
jgi:predicted nuclease of predicted toxin-antitoxin system